MIIEHDSLLNTGFLDTECDASVENVEFTNAPFHYREENMLINAYRSNIK